MSTRRIQFIDGEFYHIFNRGVDKREIFSSPVDYDRFLMGVILLNDNHDGLMIEWRDFHKSQPNKTLQDFLKGTFRKGREREPLVDVIAYCLNPNHYHFILKQVREKGIERFLHKLGTSYTKYFNKKNGRSGSLFQGVFKSVHIDSNGYLLYLSAYVNKNNFIHKYNLDDAWPYCSLPDYSGKRKDDWMLDIKKEIILGQFKDRQEYKKYMEKNATYLQKKKETMKYCLED